MKIAHVGMISTTIVIILGVGIVIHPYLPTPKPVVTLLFFNIDDSKNLPQWCYDLSDTLYKQKVQATIFITGEIAQQYPTCVRKLAQENDIGSSTFDYENLTGEDYSAQLEAVKSGKDAVDSAGQIDSQLFKAPYGITDGNIYSVLNRSGIVADFSYDKQYNKYYHDQFIRFDSISYNGTDHSSEFFKNLSSDIPIMINFDNTTPVQNIDEFISHLKSRHVFLINASQLVGANLTEHLGGQV
jgi:peptidoglycan/xylan/chitin deacetylase (PgdA/CDA1 family)